MQLIESNTHLDETQNSTHDDDYKSTKTTIENIFKLMLKFQSKIESVHTANDEKNSMQQLMSAFENRHATTTTKPMNAALSHSLLDNWTMGNNDSVNESMLGAVGQTSVLIRQSVDDDIMEVLKNSDRITWDTLDLLHKTIDKQNGKLDSILSHMGIASNQISSPLVDSIHMSNLSDTEADHTTAHMREPTDNVAFSMQPNTMHSLGIHPPRISKKRQLPKQM